MKLTLWCVRAVGAVVLVAGSLVAQQSAPTETRSLDCVAAAEHSRENSGLAVLVFERGELVFEEYQNGHRAEKPQHLFSGAKSFVPVVALVAEAEGLLTLDEVGAETLTEWKGDKHREKITVRHLLNFTSGLEHADRALHSMQVEDKYEHAVACEGVHEPGRRFRYGSNHGMAFGELFQRKLDAAREQDDSVPADFVDYLKQRVLDPIDCEVTGWIRDARGHPAMSYGALMTAREWAKFGQLLLARGRHGDAQIIPTEHFDQMFEGSRVNPIYGLNFWLRGPILHRREAAIPDDVVAAAGMYDQRLFVSPSRQIVVVRLGRTGARRSSYDDFKFLKLLFTSPPSASRPSSRPSTDR